MLRMQEKTDSYAKYGAKSPLCFREMPANVLGNIRAQGVCYGTILHRILHDVAPLFRCVFRGAYIQLKTADSLRSFRTRRMNANVFQLHPPAFRYKGEHAQHAGG